MYHYLERRVRHNCRVECAFNCNVFDNSAIQLVFRDVGKCLLDRCDFLFGSYARDNRIAFLEQKVKNMEGNEAGAACSTMG